jgi:hypothetical protein
MSMFAWINWMAVRFGYWVRPYDPVLDARRWRWEPSGCARQGPLRRALQAELDERFREQIADDAE